jgi:hypothetical protein
LAPTVGIAATGFCYPGGILQLFFLSTRSTNFSTTDSSNNQIASHKINLRLRRQALELFEESRRLAVFTAEIIMVSATSKPYRVTSAENNGPSPDEKQASQLQLQ